MIKEFILAITLGALLGFGITGSYLALNNSKKVTSIASPTPTIVQNQNTTPIPTSTSPEPTNQSSHTLTIDSPQNESIVAVSSVTIKGLTSPLSSIIVTTATKSYYTNSDDTGKFNLDIEVDSGPNQIQIDSFDPLDNQASVALLVTYSTAKI